MGTWFTELIAKAGDAAVIAAVIALLGAIVSALIALAISRRATYLTSVTTERSKWIDKLRTNLADIAGSSAYVHHKVVTDDSFLKKTEHDELVHKIEKLEAEIRLQLNPRGPIDKNIIKIVEKIGPLADKAKDTRWTEAHGLLINHSQFLLKEEWETVKFEASGYLRRIGLNHGRCKRKREYQKYCTGAGSLEPLEKAKEN